MYVQFLHQLSNMTELLCSICEKRLDGLYRDRDWYCHSCYVLYRSDIESKQEWTRYLKNLENKRRREVVIPLIYLTDRYDITEDRRLVIKDWSYGR